MPEISMVITWTGGSNFVLPPVQATSTANIATCTKPDTAEYLNRHFFSTMRVCGMMFGGCDVNLISIISIVLEPVSHGNIEIPAVFRNLYP